MSKIVNEPKIKNKLIVKIRELLEHRAFWLYLLTDEAEKKRYGSKRFRLCCYFKMWYFTGE